ncbi:dipeptide ABC transporter ATP-binding protein [Isoptericola variabilis]|uniref:Oligopeptide/dipeptide ABC transporter, ATPase subunit n=1 Tax=Isoptericola variabilis (strain 225) TaxID=743718 RepID=F6FR43_ISOV2|nr:dipeptide ABC transporter ATP-binding protein [Isoptericola variabilis]AEG44993.1 oligopeptide/dipeptide ABC transporter, ATPase subunit [Isoptericola variabilis 225]TWH25995.1 peptide/nickel transport system ATP-binding protein [Isoptericola variabilis J7]
MDTAAPPLTGTLPESGTVRTLDAVVRLRGLDVSLERNGLRSQILHGIDLEIGRGEILGVVGESGSGKSVMSMAMLGLLPEPSRPHIDGSLEVVGMNLRTASPAELREARRTRMGVVFQDPMTSLNPTMVVGRQVAEKAGSQDEAIRLMRAVGIPQPERRYRSYPHELSGGLRQRVMIAMAVAGNPDLLVADEPTTALDVTVQAQVLKLLASMRDEVGCSIVLITHDLGVAAQIADRIAVMYQGRIVETGTTQQVLQSARHPYTLGLLGSRLTLDSDRSRPLWALPTDVTARSADGCPFAPRCRFAVTTCTAAAPPLLPAPDPDPDAAAGTHLTACFEAARLGDAAAARDELDPVPPSPEPLRGASLIQAADVECTFQVRDERGRKARLGALRGVTLDVQPGESVAIVGESGSGKSTLLRVAGHLEKRFTGSLRGPRGTDVQMVFQDAGSSLTPWMTIREVLHERLSGRMPRTEKEQKARAILDRVGLPAAVLDALPGELSGGQRQRVALARATIVPPQVLLCDEPTSALDVSVAANVLNLINELRRDLGIAVMFVTHDLAVARIVGDRIAVMYLGRIVEVGRAEDVIADPRHPYTRNLVAAVPQPGKVIEPLPGEPASALDPPTGCAFHPRCPVALPECSRTVVGIQLTAVDGRPSADVARRHEVACVRRGEI